MRNEESLNEDHVKQQEIKGLVAESYNFLKELS